MKLLPFNSDHAPIIWAWYHDPALVDYFRGFVEGASIKQCANATELLRAHILMAFAGPEEKGLSRGTPLGLISFGDIDPILRVYRTGFLVDPKYQHQKFAYEIAKQGIKWAFETMNAHKLVTEILAQNQRLAKGLELFGFVKEGTKRQSTYFNGQCQDEEVWTMLKSEWRGKNRHALQTAI